MSTAHRRLVLQTTFVYAVVAGLWILASDWVLGLFVSDPRTMTELAVVKGWVFVGVTALLLYGMLRRGMLQLQRETDAQAQAQAELRRWADAFTNCAHGLAIVGPGDGEVLACNPAFAQLYNLDVEVLTGHPLLQRYAPADHVHVQNSLAEADRVGHVQFEARMRSDDDATFPVQTDVVSVRDEAGAVRYRVVTVQDIDARKAAELTVRRNEQRLRAILESLTEGLLITDLTGQPLVWNRALLKLLWFPAGMETPDLLRNIPELIELSATDGRVLGRAERPLARILRGETVDEVLYRVRRIGGDEIRVFSVAGSVVRDAAGQSMALLVVNDVTARAEALEAVRESEQRFRAVVENIHEVFWIRDGGTQRIVYVSPAFEGIWGRKAAEFTDTPVSSWLATVHPEDRARLQRVAGSADPTARFDEQYRILRPDGSIRWVRDQAFPVGGEAGRPSRIVGVAQDITERKQLEAQFLRAQRMEAVGTLAGGIAHDLNNILAPMLMAAGLLKERIADARDRDMLDMVERSARRGADIIRQLLTFSRGVEGERGTVQIRHLIKEIGAIIRETFPRQIEFDDSTPSDLWPVVADATQLHQVLVNLSVNARDAMPNGGCLSIRAENCVLEPEDPQVGRGATPGRHVVITVADTGSGMPPDVVERIFDPFFTTKAPGKGTGLGLSTVLGIVRSHRGVVTVESELGRGSVFRVFLPAAPAVTLEEVGLTRDPLPVGHGELVLVVDDEEPIRESTRHALERQNYRVLTAADGKEALTAFLPQRDQIRLVLTDMMMPQMGGAALVQALRVINPSLRVIATSGLTEGMGPVEMQALGIVEALPKPCGPKPLLEAIRRALDAAEPSDGAAPEKN
jgi:PAS domain S-box-containing protein